jgi:hypothetical protein
MPRLVSQLVEAAGRRVPVHSEAVDVAQDGPVGSVVDGRVDSPGHGRWQWDQHGLVAFAADFQDAVAVFLAKVADAGVAGFEDP